MGDRSNLTTESNHPTSIVNRMDLLLRLSLVRGQCPPYKTMMEIIKGILNSRIQELSGKAISKNEMNSLVENLKIPNIADVISILSEYQLAGCSFSNIDDNDEKDISDNESKIEIDFQWMDTSQILSEALDCYPGKIALNLGYIPIGMCVIGSGDYYYLKIDDNTREDPPLVRIFHDEIDDNMKLTKNAIKVVSPKLSTFLRSAEIY
jgi:hypothetical protein